MTTSHTPDLNRLFYPKSIAVIGASPNSANGMAMGGSSGNNYIKGAVTMNFMGKIYPVHPKGEDILGYKAYKRVRDIPGEVDLAIFTIPAAAALNVMEDCVEKGVKFAHLFTAGFSETGMEEYIALEKKLLRTAESGGIRLLGPNCMGIYCPAGGLSFQPMFSEVPGPVSFFSQSGQLTGFFVMKAQSMGLHFSKAVRFGNASDLKAHDFLEYFAQDSTIEIIGSYIEGLKEGRKFFEIARRITPKKPLVIYKGGQTEGGARATMSHTAAIAGSHTIWQAMCKQAGILSVDSLDELVYTILALQKMKLPEGNRVAILGGAGGGSVTMTDIAEKEGLSVPHLSDLSIKKLKEFIPIQGSSVKNPLDIGGNAFMGEHFPKIMTLLREDPNIDALIFSLPIGMAIRMMGRSMINILIEQSLKIIEILKKPFFLSLEKDDAFGGGEEINEVRERYTDLGIVAFPSFEMTAKIISNLNEYREFLSRDSRA